MRTLTERVRPRPCATLFAVVNCVLILLSITLAFHIESSSMQDLADSAKGQAVATAAVPGLATAGLTIIGGMRRWARIALIISAACTLIGVLLYLFT